MTLALYNTLTRRKEPFRPIDPANVRMYVCGPTVYDFAHIGNARPVIVFDVLFRLLRHIYGAEHVTYARNITDVDDKINARAAERYPDLPPTDAIRKLTTETTEQFHKDIAALGVLPPTVEPRATQSIAEMRTLIEALVQRGHAYVAENNVLFDVTSMPDYGRLANRSLEEMEAGARVDVAPYKKGPMDFVLWKPSKPGEPGWPSPSGINAAGRPGWHIECSAMADRWLWDEAKATLSAAGLAQPHVFDIHGGGIDLVFPHHENELAQSRCAHGTSVMANYWMHNGFLQVEGEKMSKSLGNFVTINELLTTDRFGHGQWQGEDLRLAMLMTNYRQPIDFSVARLQEAERMLDHWYRAIPDGISPTEPLPEVIAALEDDLNTWEVITAINREITAPRGPTTGRAKEWHSERAARVKASAKMLGLLQSDFASRHAFKKRLIATSDEEVAEQIDARSVARKAKDFKEADRIRDELSAMGIQLKDAKDPVTGEIVTTWEMKR